MLLAVVAAGFTACRGGRGTGPGIASLVPGTEELGEGWSTEDSVRSFHGRGLYDYIDGGADLYMEYGYEATAAAAWMAPSGTRIFLDLHRMKSPLAAFGIFSVTGGEHHEPLELGTAGARTGFQTIFCRGEYYCEVLAGHDSPESAAEMLAVARAVEEMLSPQPDTLPSILEHTPPQGYIEGSAAVVCGPLGLNSRHYLADRNLFALSDSVPGLTALCRVSPGSGSGIVYLWVSYPEQSMAVEVYRQLRDFYRDSRPEGTPPDELEVGPDRLMLAGGRQVDVILRRDNTLRALFEVPRGEVTRENLERAFGVR